MNSSDFVIDGNVLGEDISRKFGNLKFFFWSTQIRTMSVH